MSEQANPKKCTAKKLNKAKRTRERKVTTLNL